MDMPENKMLGKPTEGWRLKLYNIIFEADTDAGQLFDRALIVLILFSVVIVVVDTVHSYHIRFHSRFEVLEWIFTFLFSVEYICRLLCVKRPMRYALSFFGIVDLISILPTYLALIVPEAHLFIDIRVLRLLRIFRVLRLTGFLIEYQALGFALRNSVRKIMVFLSVVLMVVLILGTLLYVIEGPENGFSSIPTSVYWAITTITTVGFGDITPQTDFGRFVASLIMLMGWGTLAVPTGIVTAEMTFERKRQKDGVLPTTRTCHECLTEGHASTAKYCRDCGVLLPEYHSDDI